MQVHKAALFSLSPIHTVQRSSVVHKAVTCRSMERPPTRADVATLHHETSSAPAATPPKKVVNRHKPFITLNFEIHLNNTRHLLFVLVSFAFDLLF